MHAEPRHAPDHVAILEAFRLLYDDLDLQVVESRLIDFIDGAFDFDRTAFFYVKHRKNVIQGKHGRGFAPGVIENFHSDLLSECTLIEPLRNGAPLRFREARGERWETALGLTNYALTPILNRKRSACWEILECPDLGCSAYQKKWTHCWLISGFNCCRAADIPEGGKDFRCAGCDVFREKEMACMEGVILSDNSPTGRDISPDSLATLTIIADVVGRAISNSKLLSRAIHDAVYDHLTDLYNRRYLDKRLEEESSRARRQDESVCLLFGDIDDFKGINDTHGHMYGDLVLRRVGEILKENLRMCDVAARYGGDEFAVLLTGAKPEEALKVAEKLRDAVKQGGFTSCGNPVSVTMSFGAACLTGKEASGESLLEAADRALYEAKAAGKDCAREA